jgi:hypothetical protein
MLECCDDSDETLGHINNAWITSATIFQNSKLKIGPVDRASENDQLPFFINIGHHLVMLRFRLTRGL